MTKGLARAKERGGFRDGDIKLQTLFFKEGLNSKQIQMT